MTSRWTRALGVLVVTGLCALLGGVPAAGAADRGALRLAHLSPDTPAVDVYVDAVGSPADGLVFPGVSYGTVSDYQAVPGGTYTVSMRAAGDPTSTPPVLSTTVTVEAGKAWTVAGVGPFAGLGLAVIPDDLALPAPGQARARVLNASARLNPVDVTLSGGAGTSGGTSEGAVLAEGLGFAEQTDYVAVPGGQTTLQVGGGSAAGTDLPVELATGSTYTVLLLDTASGVQVRTILDAASPGVVPTGGVEAGGGGTAAGGAPLPLVPVGVVVLALTGLLLTAGRRLPRRRPLPGRHAA